MRDDSARHIALIAALLCYGIRSSGSAQGALVHGTCGRRGVERDDLAVIRRRRRLTVSTDGFGLGVETETISPRSRLTTLAVPITMRHLR